MNSIFSGKDPNIKILIPRFQTGLSLYYNNKSHQIGFLDKEVYNTYPEILDDINIILNPLTIEDLNKRKIYLIIKHSKWISPILVKKE